MFRTKLLRPDIEILDAAKGMARAVVSDESDDRDGDVIRAAGWVLDHFNKHPVLLSSHNYGSLRNQIGEWTDMSVKGKRLIGTAKYYVGDGNEEADWGFKLAERGKAAYSVGFVPLEYKEREGAGGGYWPPMEYLKQELLEVSAVTIPANRNALQLMAKGDLPPLIATLVREELGPEAPDIEAITAEVWKRIAPDVDARIAAALAAKTPTPDLGAAVVAAIKEVKF